MFSNGGVSSCMHSHIVWEVNDECCSLDGVSYITVPLLYLNQLPATCNKLHAQLSTDSSCAVIHLVVLFHIIGLQRLNHYHIIYISITSSSASLAQAKVSGIATVVKKYFFLTLQYSKQSQ